jgi:GTP-binding protein
MAQRDDRKRLGKKHRDASTRPKKGRAPRVTPTTGAVDPRKRKVLSTKKALAERKKRTPTRSPENESRRTIAPKPSSPKSRPADNIVGRQTPHSANIGRHDTDSEAAADIKAWRESEILAAQMSLAADSAAARNLPLIAICGRPNVGKSTLFNRLTGSRRSIVGDEPGITRDRIYGQIEWMGTDARIVDTGGIVPDDEALIPSEIFRQAQVALSEANAIIMVIDGRTELASPDLELARLLLRGGKPTFLAVNKMDTDAMQPQAENFRRLGFANVLAISAEHNVGIGDLLDEVFAALPEPTEEIVAPAVMLSAADEMEEDEDGPDFSDPVGASIQKAVILAKPESLSLSFDPDDPDRPRRLRSHGSFLEHETKIAIIGRPNVGKSTLLNALTGTERAIVSPIAGTTRDAVDEVVTRGNHDFRFVDTAGIRRKGKTKLMAEKLSVINSNPNTNRAGGFKSPGAPSIAALGDGWDAKSPNPQPADPKIYEQQVRDKLKYLEYAPLVFISASSGKGIEALFKKIELVSRERRKRVTTGQMNRFLAKVDFQKASVPMNRRVRIYYMTQAAVAPPTFVLFTDRDVKLHFAFERFLANQIRENFGFIGSPIWFKTRPRNKKKVEE